MNLPQAEPAPDVADLLRREIAAAGVIPFTQFMERALYHPNLGYYERGGPRLGRRGDFFTSVSVGSLFGELLGFQFAGWLDDLAMPAGHTPCLVEGGGHDGRLAADILGWFSAHRPDWFQRLTYWFLEPSSRQRQAQQAATRAFAGTVRWASTWAEFPASGVQGVIFANELLDAFPVRRIGWDAGAQTWFEWGVAATGDRFVWARMPGEVGRGQLALLSRLPPGLLAVLPNGFTTEICPAAEAWWRQAACALRHGWLLTFDYGLSAEEFFSPARAEGTLRAYRRHHVSDDVLAHPGEQDLTAHVNLTALRGAGEDAGLQTEACASQAAFLTPIAARAWGPRAGFGDWTPRRKRQLQTLTHAEHLGERFTVLLQSRRSDKRQR